MKRLFTLAALLVLFAACTGEVAEPRIIPQPASMELGKGSLNVKGITFCCDPSLDDRSFAAVEEFAAQLSLVSGKKCNVSGDDGAFSFVKDDSVPAEGYAISVTRTSAEVRASDFNGVFYALQTLRQMLPVSIYGSACDDCADWRIPCCKIEDAPRFAYRGFHLDCCRHFFSREEIKKLIDVMSVFKYNRFHWHLTEDQGWRIELDVYPRLTEVGAWRNGTMIGGDWDSNDGIEYGGFYTRDEIRDLIEYADARGITFIPEIDLPGHMQAALAAYPNLGCKGSQPQPYEVWTIWGVSKQVLNVGKEETLCFLEDVLDEVADIFPGEYFNIGGDECPKDEWKTDPDCQAKIKELGLVSDEKASAEARLQNYVTARMQKFLATKGKKIIGWDEILEGDLAEGATVMSWRGTSGGIKAASMGYDVIMSPTTYCYFDYVQGHDLVKEPFSITHQWAKNKEWEDNPLTLEKVYGYEPLAEIPAEAQKHILGVQCNMWTEYIAEPDYLEFMYFPRALALAEVQWCSPENKDFERFSESLEEHALPLLKQLGVNYRELDK